jgi:Tfp pilus assembly protein PilX
MKPSVQQRGAALMMALMVLMIVSIGATVVFRHWHLSLQAQRNHIQAVETRHLAEAGLEKALAQLRLNPDYTGEENTPLGAGAFSVAVRSGAGFREYTLIATGATDQGKTRLTGQLRFASDGAVAVYHWTEGGAS